MGYTCHILFTNDCHLIFFLRMLCKYQIYWVGWMNNLSLHPLYIPRSPCVVFLCFVWLNCWCAHDLCTMVTFTKAVTDDLLIIDLNGLTQWSDPMWQYKIPLCMWEKLKDIEVYWIELLVTVLIPNIWASAHTGPNAQSLSNTASQREFILQSLQQQGDHKNLSDLQYFMWGSKQLPHQSGRHSHNRMLASAHAQLWRCGLLTHGTHVGRHFFYQRENVMLHQDGYLVLELGIS